MGDRVLALARALGLDTPEVVRLAPREFAAKTRERMAEKGTAMSDGSYPIPDLDALDRAIKAWGRCPPEKRGALRSHLRKRAAALGAGADYLQRISGLEA